MPTCPLQQMLPDQHSSGSQSEEGSIYMLGEGCWNLNCYIFKCPIYTDIVFRMWRIFIKYLENQSQACTC